MKQLHFVNSTCSQGGGQAVAASKYAGALALTGAVITLVSRNEPGICSNECKSLFKSVYLSRAKNLILDLCKVFCFTSQLVRKERPHLIHLHGLWSPFLAVVALVARINMVPLVISPHGCLEPWALNNKRLKKRIAMWMYQSAVLRAASMIMVTAEQERHSVRRLELNQPVAIVPNGVDVPVHVEVRRNSDLRTFLFLSRIHPGKGLLDLVEAWAAVRQPEWRIVIAGGDEDGHQAQVKNLIRQKGLESDFFWIGFVNGEAREACFTQSDVFVLPTYSENFGIAIAEALAHGLPVITTTGAPWPGLLTHRCGWWVEPGVPGITSALTQALACSTDELKGMGQRGRQWVSERFSWAKVGSDAALAGAWLLDRSKPPPDFIDIVAIYN